MIRRKGRIMLVRQTPAIRIFLVSLLVGLLFVTSNAFAATLTVCVSGCNSTTIQGAINLANDGDSIIVSSGTYNEQINVNKNNLVIQSLSGAASTIINSTDTTNGGIVINGNGNTIDDFTIRDFTNTDYENKIIRINGNNNILKNNKIQGNLNQIGVTDQTEYGLLIYGSGNVIDFNEVYDIGYIGINVVYMPTFGGNIISSNNVHSIGIYAITIDRSPFNNVTNNSISNLLGGTLNLFGEGDYYYDPQIWCWGIVVWGADSTGTIIDKQIISSSPNGITLSATVNVTIQNSEIFNSSYIGIKLADSSWIPDAADNNKIIYNKIHHNNDGIVVKTGGYGGIGSDNSINWNDIHGNTNYGVNNFASVIVNAENNWWGASSGPYNSTTNPSGTGDTVSGNVDYDPWLHCLQDSDCGFCEKCDNWQCVYQSNSEDLKDDCPGATCKTGYCDGSGSCDNIPSSTLCDSNYICSGTPGGDNMYGVTDFRIPSQGYCDGYGNCDYSNSLPICSLGKTGVMEGSGFTMCWDGYAWCRDTCSDSVDNDGDTCVDNVDEDCGGTELICNDGMDNDCDGFTDCLDSDCVNANAIGPGGKECCSTITDCPGSEDSCKTCASNECDPLSTAYVCDLDYLCSDSFGGDNSYGVFDFKSPRQSYCDGLGNCDYTLSSGTICELGKNPNTEGSGLNYCQDGTSWCRDSCSDGIDNDGDGLIDAIDTDCGATDIVPPSSTIIYPNASSWQNKNFTVYVSDYDNYLLSYCQYRVWSFDGFLWTLTKDWTNRTCNSTASMTITVGLGNDCRDQGVDACEVHVKAVDNATNGGNDDYRKLSIDWGMPDITNLKPSRDSYTNNRRPEISARYYDYLSGTNQSTVKIIFDGLDRTGQSIITSSKIGYMPSVDLGDGVHNVTVKVNDVAGNAAQKDWSFIVDTAIPAIIIYSPQNSSVYNNSKILLRINVSETVNKMEYALDKGAFNSLCRGCDNYFKNHTFSYGLHTLTVRAIDYAGNVNQSSINFFIDNIPPKIIKTLPENQTITDSTITNKTRFYVKYTESDLNSVALYWKEQSAASYTKEPLSCVNGTNKECWLDKDLNSFDGKNINYYFEIKDPLNVVEYGVKTITIDNTPPTVKINSPEALTYSERRIYLTIEVDENAERIEYSLDGSRPRSLCNDCESYNRTMTFSDGEHILLVRAVDYAGNVGDDTIDFATDSKPSKIKKQYPSNNKYTNGTFIVTYDEDNLKNVTLFYKGVLEPSWQKITKFNCLAGNNKQCNFYVNLGSYNNQLIRYYLVLMDEVSSTKSKEYTAYVDMTVPIVKINSPQPISYDSHTIRLDVNSTEPVKLQYLLYPNGDRFRNLCSKCSTYNRTKSFDEGPNVLIIQAIDRANNLNTTTVSFTVNS